jgi:hypothetical protein
LLMTMPAPVVHHLKTPMMPWTQEKASSKVL